MAMDLNVYNYLMTGYNTKPAASKYGAHKTSELRSIVRDIANSLFQKWALKGFFPAGERSEPRSRTARRAPADRSPRRIATWAASGVAVPLAFFCTLFFRHRKKSVSAP